MWQMLWSWARRKAPGWCKRPPLILVNGLAEQSESWYRNRWYWERYFDVKVPEILVYGGPQLQRRIAQGLPIDVPYLTEALEEYLDRFVQRPPYFFVASSLGCQVVVEYAVRRPDQVARMVLLCPSGFGDEERLPVVEGVRHHDMEGLLKSIFHDPAHVDAQMLAHLRLQMQERSWKKALLRTVRGTAEHSVRDKLPQVRCPTLVICGKEDRIVDPIEIRQAVQGLPQFKYLALARCGHAPQIERYRQVNRLVRAFLTVPETQSQRRPLAPQVCEEPVPVGQAETGTDHGSI